MRLRDVKDPLQVDLREQTPICGFLQFPARICIPPPPQKKLVFFLPALQKTFVDFFYEFAWGFGIEKWQGFWVEF